MTDFNHKIVWITGASSGIGEALAVAFSRQNAKLVLSARRKEELERVCALCLHPDQHLILPLDLENQNNFQEAVDAVMKHFGRIDILVNNGGISQRAEADKTPMEVERRIMEVNYFGTIALTKLVLPVMQNQKSGHIVVMSSIAGKFGFYLRAAYSASKHALHGYFESLRMENEKYGIRVLIVCPGKIKTPISMSALNEKGEKHAVMDHQQLGGLEPAECARQILKGVQKNKEEILVGGKEIKAVFLKRFFPRLFGKIIRKQPAV